VGAYKGDVIAEYLRGKGLEPITALRDTKKAKKRMAGRIDLWASGDPAGRYLAKQAGIPGFKTILRGDSAGLYLALNKELPDQVVQTLQAPSDKMRSEGLVDDIQKNYL
jgi:polar amino acid transport system substrate-binding protein